MLRKNRKTSGKTLLLNRDYNPLIALIKKQYKLGDSLKYKEKPFNCVENNKILIDTEKFKEILTHSWHLLPAEKQKELLEIGIYPRKQTP